MLQAWNIQTNAEFSLSAPAGQVHAMEVGNEMLFAGTQVKSLSYLILLRFWDFRIYLHPFHTWCIGLN